MRELSADTIAGVQRSLGPRRHALHVLLAVFKLLLAALPATSTTLCWARPIATALRTDTRPGRHDGQ